MPFSLPSYYSTTEPFKPASRQIVKLNINTGKTECLSCQLNSHCLEFSATISPEKNYWIVTCMGRSMFDYDHKWWNIIGDRLHNDQPKE